MMGTYKKLLTAGVLALSVNFSFVPMSHASNDWNPISSERLIKLPTNVMERAINHDFNQSHLASKLQSADSQLNVTQMDLAQLQGAIAQAQGEEKVELRHQYLEQKSSYIDQMEVRQTLRRDELKTRLNVYQGLLKNLQKDKRRAQDPVSLELIEQQDAARKRMESIASQVDDSLFDVASQEQSKYAKEYDQNLQKMKKLQLAIQQHEMSRDLGNGDGEMTRESYIRSLMADAEADLALLNQEDEMLGYMARLVAMDAQALQIEITYGSMDSDAYTSEVAATKPANMVDFFIN
jgi:hypothetical protein